MTGGGEDFATALRRAGVVEGKPLHAVLMTAHDAARAAETAVRDGARGLTPEGERQLVERAAFGIASRAEGVIDRRTARLGWRVGLGMAALVAGCSGISLATGYWLGSRAGAAEARALSAEFREVLDAGGLESARLWVQVVRFNPRISASHFRNRVEVGGWLGGDLPLWYERVGPPGG